MLFTVTSGVVVKKLRSGLTWWEKKCPLCKLDKKSSKPAKNADGTLSYNRGLENGASLQACPPVLTNSSGQQERACIKQMKGEVWSDTSGCTDLHMGTLAHTHAHTPKQTPFTYTTRTTHIDTHNISILFFNRKEDTKSVARGGEFDLGGGGGRGTKGEYHQSRFLETLKEQIKKWKKNLLFSVLRTISGVSYTLGVCFPQSYAPDQEVEPQQDIAAFLESYKVIQGDNVDFILLTHPKRQRGMWRKIRLGSE